MVKIWKMRLPSETATMTVRSNNDVSGDEDGRSSEGFLGAIQSEADLDCSVVRSCLVLQAEASRTMKRYARR